MSNEQTHLLQKGDSVQHLASGRGGKVQHVSARRGKALIRHADGTERPYLVAELYVRDPRTDDWTARCRVEL